MNDQSASIHSSTPLWLDVDTGHDDAFALLLASQYPALTLLGVSTIYGNAPLTHTTHNTLAILHAIGRDDVPVYAGAAKPFCRAAAAAPDIHGESGLDGTTCLPTPTATARTYCTAVEAMYRSLISQPAGKAWLVATGALTNIALCFALHPDLASHLAGVSIMGGAIGDGFTAAPMGKVEGEGERFGNWTPWAEFNVYLDPESASAIFSNPVLVPKTTLVTLDLTHQFLATEEVQRGLLHGFADEHEGVSSVRKLFHEILMFFAKTYADVFRLTEGPPLHDVLAVAAAFLPELFHDGDGERYAISVVTDGEHGSSDHVRSGGSQCGRTVAKLLPKGEAGVRVPTSLEVKETWRILEDCLTRAERRGESGGTHRGGGGNKRVRSE